MIIEKTNVIIGDNTVGHMEELRFGKRRMTKAIFNQIHSVTYGSLNENYLMRPDVSILGYVVQYITLHGGLRGLCSYTTSKAEQRHYLMYNNTDNKFDRIVVYSNDYMEFNKLLEKKGVKPNQLIIGA